MTVTVIPLTKTFKNYVKQWGQTWILEKENVADCEFGDAVITTSVPVHNFGNGNYPFSTWGFVNKDFILEKM